MWRALSDITRVSTSMVMCLFSRLAANAPIKADHNTIIRNRGSAHTMLISSTLRKTICALANNIMATSKIANKLSSNR